MMKTSVVIALAATSALAQTFPGDGGADHCPRLTPRPGGPSSINDVRFDELDIIMAMGDSITTCTGCDWDQTWSHGGRNGTDTLGSLFLHFNPNLYGQATGPAGRERGLNFAVAGAVASSLPGQARNLVNTLRTDRNVDFNNDWKMVTWWIGGNNVCAACRGGNQHTPQGYKNSLLETLEILSQVPRLRVQMMTQPIYSSLYYLTRNVLRCATNRALCGCVMNSESAARESDALAQEYSRVTYEAAEEWDGRGNEFAVTVQPIGDESEVYDIDYLWLDCFHFDYKLHYRMGHTFFNSMQESAGNKPTAIDYETPAINCPTVLDRIQ